MRYVFEPPSVYVPRPPHDMSREVYRNFQSNGKPMAVWDKFEDDGREYGIEVDYENNFMRLIRLPDRKGL